MQETKYKLKDLKLILIKESRIRDKKNKLKNN
jgi:hypothetical protein